VDDRSTLAQVRDLTDKQQIVDILSRFCECIDECDIDGAICLFTEDCVSDYGPGRGGLVRGRDQLRKRFLHSQTIIKRAHHQLGQVRIELDGDSARSRAYMTAWHERIDGQIQVARLQYRDSFVRRIEGWAISYRTGIALGVEGFGTEEWNWLVRQQTDKSPGGSAE
jgi:hypothetical protein